MLGVHEDTLRNWDEQGLVVADRVGTRRDRRYTAEHVRMVYEQGLVSDLAKKGSKEKDYSRYTKERLIKELQLLKKQQRYGLVWEEKIEEVVERCKSEAPILKSVSEMSIEGGKDEQKHILIEGDNYHALEVLNYTHKGKIDVIYIDPPYNTGNKDFCFNDNFVDKEDAYRHSKWLSFMEKRLRSAKNLLSDKGVMFISIDDNEQAALKILCDQIFGEKNFVADIIWNSRKSVSSDTIVSLSHNHTLLYTKDIDFVRESVKKGVRFKMQVGGEKFVNPDNDPRGPWTVDPFDAPNIRPNLTYPIKNLKTGKDFMPPKGRCWRTTKEEYKTLLKKGRIIFGKRGTSKPQLKRYLSDAKEKGLTPKSIWDDVGTTTSGTQELEEIFGEKKFNNPKPVSFIKRTLDLSMDKSGVALDFFAGSGTTGHAVMELNKEDGGNRQFILCTNNENNNRNGSKGMARGVCQPRVKKVMKGYKKNGNGEKVEGLGGSLEYLKTEFVDVENISTVSDKKKLEFTHEAGYTIALKENTFAEVEKNDWYQIFTDEKDKFVGVYFREDLEKLEEFEGKILDKPEVKLYIFSYSGNYDWRNDYAEYGNVSVESIPEPILRVYKSVNW